MRSTQHIHQSTGRRARAVCRIASACDRSGDSRFHREQFSNPRRRDWSRRRSLVRGRRFLQHQPRSPRLTARWFKHVIWGLEALGLLALKPRVLQDSPVGKRVHRGRPGVLTPERVPVRLRPDQPRESPAQHIRPPDPLHGRYPEGRLLQGPLDRGGRKAARVGGAIDERDNRVDAHPYRR